VQGPTVGQWTRLLLTLTCIYPTQAFAQAAESPPHHSFSSQLLFWTGGVVIIIIMGRIMFREQIHERRTLGRLINEIGPFYREFDIDSIKRWVFRCAPHVWHGWQTGTMAPIHDFTTPEFREAQTQKSRELVNENQTRTAEFSSVLKVHPLGIYMAGDGPAPRDVELMLRLEIKAENYILSDDGALVEGQRGMRQIQYFWILRHDGLKWRLHRVWVAESDANDLASRPLVPPVDEWSRPKLDSDGQEQG
jgi:hypothetical protein